MKLVVLVTGILEELKWETLQKRRKDNRLILLYKGLKSKARIPTDDLIQRTGVAEINSQWSFRFPLLVQMPTRKASFHKDSYRHNRRADKNPYRHDKDRRFSSKLNYALFCILMVSFL